MVAMMHVETIDVHPTRQWPCFVCCTVRGIAHANGTLYVQLSGQHFGAAAKRDRSAEVSRWLNMCIIQLSRS